MKKQNEEFRFSVVSSPQIRGPLSTGKIMLYVILALLPAALWGVFQFGWYALLVLAVSIAASVIGEGLVCLIRKKNTLSDGSAVLTGLLVGMNMPPSVPIYIPAAASLVAIIVFKAVFGGLGCNIINPALGGRLFAFFSWSSAMFTFQTPRAFLSAAVGTADAVASATPLTVLKSAAPEYAGAVANEMELLPLKQYPVTAWDTAVTDRMNEWFGESFCYGYFDAFFGFKGGCIGEISAFLLLLGGLFLLAKKIIRWEIPVAFIGMFALLVWIFGGLRAGTGFFSGDPLYQVLTGGLMLGAFFMATDMVTSPFRSGSMLLFGAGCGLLTFLIRFYGSFPEGVSLAIVFMNLTVPMLDRLFIPRRFGIRRKKKGENA